MTNNKLWEDAASDGYSPTHVPVDMQEKSADRTQPPPKVLWATTSLCTSHVIAEKLQLHERRSRAAQTLLAPCDRCYGLCHNDVTISLCELILLS